MEQRRHSTSLSRHANSVAIMKASRGSSTLRFAVDEVPPHLLAAGLGLQVVMLIIASIALTPIVVLRAAGPHSATT